MEEELHPRRQPGVQARPARPADLSLDKDVNQSLVLILDRVMLTEKCFPQRLRDCRVVPEFREFSFVGEYCQPRPMTKCFNYMKKVCVPQSKTEYKLVAWQNEKLKVIQA